MCSNWLLQILTMDTSWQVLAQAEMLQDAVTARVFNVTENNVAEVISQRRDLLSLIFPDFERFCQIHLQTNPKTMLKVLWDLWLPLGCNIAVQRENLGKPLIKGILGAQGTGKTTMSRVLKLILENLGYRTVCLSLDDLYKTYSDRLKLIQQDSRLIWRGPPGTHDIHLALSLLDQVLQGKSSVEIPRFDKSAYNGMGDRTIPEIIPDPIDIILFEGWFVGVPPISEHSFIDPPHPIITQGDRQFAIDMNNELKNYLPLWEKLDNLIVLYPQDYRYCLQWRKQAEHQMIATGKTGMSDDQITEFVYYFWRALHPELFINPLISSSDVDLVIKIDQYHNMKL